MCWSKACARRPEARARREVRCEVHNLPLASIPLQCRATTSAWATSQAARRRSCSSPTQLRSTTKVWGILKVSRLISRDISTANTMFFRRKNDKLFLLLKHRSHALMCRHPTLTSLRRCIQARISVYWMTHLIGREMGSTLIRARFGRFQKMQNLSIFWKI